MAKLTRGQLKQNAAPIRIYSDLAGLIAANPAHDCIYLTLDKGMWCYWDGPTFVVGGTYGDLIDKEEADKWLT